MQCRRYRSGIAESSRRQKSREDSAATQPYQMPGCVRFDSAGLRLPVTSTATLNRQLAPAILKAAKDLPSLNRPCNSARFDAPGCRVNAEGNFQTRAQKIETGNPDTRRKRRKRRKEHGVRTKADAAAASKGHRP